MLEVAMKTKYIIKISLRCQGETVNVYQGFRVGWIDTNKHLAEPFSKFTAGLRMCLRYLWVLL